MTWKQAVVLSLVAICLAASAESQQIYWKRDHIYRGPGGKEIATVTPLPADQIAPTAPPNLTNPSTTSTTVQLTWTGSTDTGGSGLAGYKIYRGSLPVGTVGPATLSFTDKPLRPNTAYQYQIIAFDGAQNLSAPSNTLSVTTSP